MSQQKLLKHVIQALNRAGIQHMLTGSIVSSLQGEPRSTHDIDIVVAITKSKVHKLIEAFPPPNFYLDEQSVLDAIDRRGTFNLIESKSGDKVDFWILTKEPFDQLRFSRRYREEFMGLEMQVSSPEDTILAKLRWAKLSGGSEKQFTDALRVYEVQYGKLDINYIEHWAKALGIESLWKRLMEEAETV
ncbi:MAG: hypothetical protein QMD05_04240 [Candidatus Brocadiaceae bacterium]|nr:hypothetical protein [Candidatus Brocadiaceae bacterium]